MATLKSGNMGETNLHGIEAIVGELQENIKTELSVCDSVDTPFVCQAISTPKGHTSIENLIIEKIINSKISIGEAIVEIETELNPNSYYN